MGLMRDLATAVRTKVAPPLNEGQYSPDFSLEDQDGNAVHLFDFRGHHKVVLVFYPGDDTPTCTQQLCELRDSWSDLQKMKVKVFGINHAGRASKKKFEQNHHFPFPLLSDPGASVSREFQSTLPGIARSLRTVYVVGEDGKILFARPGKPALSEILTAIRA